MEQQSTMKEGTKNALLSSSNWAKYAAYFSIANLGLGFVQMFIGTIKGDPNIMSSLLPFIVSGIISVVMAVNLLNFSKFSKLGMNHGDSTQLAQGFQHLKVYFSIIGVIFIILLSLLTLGMLIFLIAFISK